jgi:small-conductance mechanosensitive channel
VDAKRPVLLIRPHPVEDVHILLAGFALAILHRGYRILAHDFDVLMLGGFVRQTAEWRELVTVVPPAAGTSRCAVPARCKKPRAARRSGSWPHPDRRPGRRPGFGDYGIQIRMKMTTKPGEQFVIRRKALARIKEGFDENGIRFALPSVQVGGDQEAAPAAAQSVVQRLRPVPPDE